MPARSTPQSPTGSLRPLPSRPVPASQLCLFPPAFLLSSCTQGWGEKEEERERGRPKETEGNQE